MATEHIAVSTYIGFVREATAPRTTAPSSFTDIGSVVEFSPEPKPDAREVWGPAPAAATAFLGKYVRLEIIETRRALDFTAQVESASSLFYELLYGTAASPSTTYTPGAVKTLRGWCEVKQYDHDGNLKNTLKVFGRITVSGVRYAGDVVAWSLQFQEIFTTAATGTLADLPS